MAPLFTVGIAFRNPGKYFELALQSVFAQTRGDWELRSWDDGSTQDGSVELAKSLDDSRVRVIVDGDSRNLNIRLNQMGTGSAGSLLRSHGRGRYHAPIARLSRLLPTLAGRGEDCVVGSGCYSIDENSRIIGQRVGRGRQREGFAARHSFIHPTVAAHTAWFRARTLTPRTFFFTGPKMLNSGAATARSRQNLSGWTNLCCITGRPAYSPSQTTWARASGTSVSHEVILRKTMPNLAWYLTRGNSAKCWLTALMSGLGCEAWIVRKRYQLPTLEGRERAERDLVQVRNIAALPIR